MAASGLDQGITRIKKDSKHISLEKRQEILMGTSVACELWMKTCCKYVFFSEKNRMILIGGKHSYAVTDRSDDGSADKYSSDGWIAEHVDLQIRLKAVYLPTIGVALYLDLEHAQSILVLF